MVSTKVSSVIGLLRKLKYIFPPYILHTIYNSLILPHINYSLLAWGTKCQKIELLQKKAVRVVHSKSPIAHTNPLPGVPGSKKKKKKKKKIFFFSKCLMERILICW